MENEVDVIEQKLYVLVDKVARRASPVFEAVNHATALRLVNSAQTVKQAPADYELYCVGERTRFGEMSSYQLREQIEIVIKE